MRLISLLPSQHSLAGEYKVGELSQEFRINFFSSARREALTTMRPLLALSRDRVAMSGCAQRNV